MYIILLFLGLFIGAVFLMVLLIGDKQEARLEAQKKALQEQIKVASEPVEGTWPPPPSASVLSTPAPSDKPVRALVWSRKNVNIVRAFFLYRSYAAGTLIVSALVSSSYPQFNLGWILFVTTLAAIALRVAVAKLKKSQHSSNHG